jgi:hypothetical protein
VEFLTIMNVAFRQGRTNSYFVFLLLGDPSPWLVGLTPNQRARMTGVMGLRWQPEPVTFGNFSLSLNRYMTDALDYQRIPCTRYHLTLVTPL